MAAVVDPMSPEASPGKISKRAGVRRVNNLPMYLVGAAVTVFLVIMALVAADRAAQQHRVTEPARPSQGNASRLAQEITGSQGDGIIPADRPLLPPPTVVPPTAAASQPLTGLPGESGSLVKVADAGKDAPPPPPPRTQANERNARNEELERIRIMKMQMLEEAIKARTGVPVADLRNRAVLPSSGGSTAREDTLSRLAEVRQQIEAAQQSDPTRAYQARLQQLRAASLGGGYGADDAAAPQLLQPATPRRNDIQQFAGSGEGDRWRLNSEPEPPRTPFELRAGFVIPATLISGINSDLPGQIMAQVSQNIYDTPTGRYLLIPQGSRLVGTYSSDVAYGQQRVLIAWQRIIFPDGKAMDIGAMPGADSAGYAGLKDQVNNHYFRIFASAILMSGVTAGITYNQNQGSNSAYGQQRASDALSEALGQQLGQVTAQMIAKNLNIAPTLEIRPGYRFNVIAIKDMAFSKPYRPFDY